MGLTQQLNSFGELGSAQTTNGETNQITNPFSSPSKTHLHTNTGQLHSMAFGSPVLMVPHNSPVKDQQGVNRQPLFGTQNGVRNS